MSIVVPDIACLREPNLLIPGKKPVGPVKIDWGHPLARDLLSFVVPQQPQGPTSNGIKDVSGHRLVVSSGANLEISSDSSSPNGIGEFVLGLDRTSGVENKWNVEGVKADASKDITFLTRVLINNLYYDRGLFSANNSNWSWLDANGGVLRISAYTTYDTTNVISTAGVYTVGLIWRADNTYQTIYNGNFSQSGSATRQSVTSDIGIQGKAAYDFSPSGNKHLFAGYWWAAWNRSLSEEETKSMATDPYQFLIPA